MKHETGPTGVAAGLQAWDWEGWQPALRWHAGSCSTKSWWWSLTSLQLALIPNSKAHSVYRMSTIHCPTSIFSMRNGKHHLRHHLLFSTACCHHRCFNCPPIQGFLGEGCSCKQWEEGKGPQYPKSPLGKSHTLYGSISAFLWSSRILPLNNTDTHSQLRARTDSKSSSVPALQTRRMGRGKIFSPLCKSTWKIHPAEGFLQLPT